MQHSNFTRGQSFWMSGCHWRCTDIGERVITAIKIDQEDASWYNGPPYAVLETVIDEYDFEACYLTREEDAAVTAMISSEEFEAANREGERVRKLEEGIPRLKVVRLRDDKFNKEYSLPGPFWGFSAHYLVLGEVEDIRHYKLMRVDTGEICSGYIGLDRFEEVSRADL